MTPRDWILLVAIGLLVLGMLGLLVGGLAGAYCEHPPIDRVRNWLPQHRYIVTCKLCQRVIERGRDKTHRAPDGAPGVKRGIRKSA